jgi:hypothetical protein
MKRIILFLLIFVISLSGCFGWKPFQPAPPEYRTWKKQGRSELDVKKSILECGYLNVLDGGEMGLNGFVLAYRCMINQGYTYYDRDFCYGFHNPPPACSPNAVIPEPSVERRLNSRYCKSERAHNRPECQP